ncbi:MAG: GDSL-type esterase/lipase family protein, partial [Cryobacterium sp.]
RGLRGAAAGRNGETCVNIVLDEEVTGMKMRSKTLPAPLFALAVVLTLTGAASPGLVGPAPAEQPALHAGPDIDPSSGAPSPRGTDPSPRWIAAWGATPEGTQSAPADSSVRNIVRISVTGTEVRVRIANPRPGGPSLSVGSATVALQQGTLGADVVPGTTTVLTFDGKPGIVVAPGTDAVYSDAVTFPVTANSNLAVTLHLPLAANPDVGGSQWNSSYATTAGGGDQTGNESGSAFPTVLDETYALTAVDVLSTDADGAFVGLGSSTLHGSNSTRDGYDRVLDLLITRNQTEVAAGNRKGIVGAGIGGDTLHAAVGRLDRDVLSQSGVTGVVVWATNDLITRTAAQIIADYEIVIARSHAADVKVLCPTWLPAAQSLGASEERSKLNDWIGNSGRCDDTVDWDRTMRSDSRSDSFQAEFFSDGIHPNAAGHAALSEATPLRWFTDQPYPLRYRG